MRYCKDCEHFIYTTTERPPICGRFKRQFVVSEHPVFGPRTAFSAPDCAVARGEKGQCGPQARFFQPRYGSAAWAEARRVTEAADRVVEAADKLIDAAAATRPWWKFW